MNYYINVPFDEIPRELVEQLNSCCYTYHEYLKACALYDALPIYWNFIITNEDSNTLAAVWGILEPLEKFLHIVRISILPEVREESNEVLLYIGKVIEEATRRMGATHAFFITDKPDIFFNKVPGKVKMSEGKLLEVVINESIH